MSSNNYLLIEKIKPKEFKVTHRDMDTDYIINRIGFTKGAEQALKMAEKFIDDLILKEFFGVEFGIRYIERKKK